MKNGHQGQKGEEKDWRQVALAEVEQLIAKLKVVHPSVIAQPILNYAHHTLIWATYILEQWQEEKQPITIRKWPKEMKLLHQIHMHLDRRMAIDLMRTSGYLAALIQELLAMDKEASHGDTSVCGTASVLDRESFKKKFLAILEAAKAHEKK